MTEVRCWRDQAGCLEVVSADYDPLIVLERAGRLTAVGRLPVIQAGKTHRERGHPLSAENTYRAPDGQRRCRICPHEAQPTRTRRRRQGGDADVA